MSPYSCAHGPFATAKNIASQVPARAVHSLASNSSVRHTLGPPGSTDIFRKVPPLHFLLWGGTNLRAMLTVIWQQLYLVNLIQEILIADWGVLFLVCFLFPFLLSRRFSQPLYYLHQFFRKHLWYVEGKPFSFVC